MHVACLSGLKDTHDAFCWVTEEKTPQGPLNKKAKINPLAAMSALTVTGLESLSNMLEKMTQTHHAEKDSSELAYI